MNEVMTETISTSPHAARRLGDVRIVRRVSPNTRSGVAITFAARCQSCPSKAEKSAPLNSPPDFIAQLFRKQGWEISNTCEDITCPACLAKRQADRREKPITQATVTNPDYILAMATMHRLLLEHFDKGSRHYDHDWDDARIGDECGLGETHVAHVREIAYGPVEPRINALLIELQRQLKELNEWIGKEHQDLREMIDTFLQEGNTRLYALSREVNHALHPPQEPRTNPTSEEKH